MNNVFRDLFIITFNGNIHCRAIQYSFKNKTEINTINSQNKPNDTQEENG
jgi:hypothetical protein